MTRKNFINAVNNLGNYKCDNYFENNMLDIEMTNQFGLVFDYDACSADEDGKKWYRVAYRFDHMKRPNVTGALYTLSDAFKELADMMLGVKV